MSTHSDSKEIKSGVICVKHPNPLKFIEENIQLKTYRGFDLRAFSITSIAMIRKRIQKSRIVLLIILKNDKNLILVK